MGSEPVISRSVIRRLAAQRVLTEKVANRVLELEAENARLTEERDALRKLLLAAERKIPR